MSYRHVTDTMIQAGQCLPYKVFAALKEKKKGFNKVNAKEGIVKVTEPTNWLSSMISTEKPD